MEPVKDVVNSVDSAEYFDKGVIKTTAVLDYKVISGKNQYKLTYGFQTEYTKL